MCSLSPTNPPVAVGVPSLPIIAGENRADGNRIHSFTGCEEIGIILARQAS
jgi:hypothetical protein